MKRRLDVSIPEVCGGALSFLDYERPTLLSDTVPRNRCPTGRPRQVRLVYLFILIARFENVIESSINAWSNAKVLARLKKDLGKAGFAPFAFTCLSVLFTNSAW